MRKRSILPGMLLFLLFCLQVSVAQTSPSEIEVIQEAIDEKGLSWTAAENDITRMSDFEKRAMLGGLPEPPGTPERPPERIGRAEALPAYFSWGDKDGHNWMTSVKSQGSCGSCWAFAAAGTFEANFRIDLDHYDYAIDVSEQNMVSCWKGDCQGWYMSSTLDNFQSNGSPDETCFPYVSGSGYVPSCGNRCLDWFNRAFLVENWGYWFTPSVTAMKTEIQNSGPIAVWMMVYTDFWYYSGGVYEYASGSEQGGHFVVLYGWDDANNCWLGKNSWATTWGEVGPDGTRGWFRIRMGTNESGCEDWVYWLDPHVCADSDHDGYGDPGYPGNECPVDNCPTVYNPGQEDNDGDGTGNACCCVGLTGNVECDPNNISDIDDLTRLIDFLYIRPGVEPLCCPDEANVDGDPGSVVDISDLTALIRYLYISQGTELPASCP